MCRLASIAFAMLCAVSFAQAGDRGADGQFSERKSAHFHLFQDVAIDRYSGVRGTRQFEKNVLDALERAYKAVSDTVGLRPRQRVPVVIYDPEIFDSRFSGLFGFRAAGFFDGTIHVRGDVRVDTRVVRTLHHEYTHAVLQSELGAGLLPAWFNEGLAEYFEARAIGQRGIGAAAHRFLSEQVRSGGWISLSRLGAPSFSHMDGETASLAYVEAHAAIEHLAHRHGTRKIERFIEEIGRTRNLHRALDRIYRMDLDELDRNLAAEFRE